VRSSASRTSASSPTASADTCSTANAGPRRELARRQDQPARCARIRDRAAQDDEREPRQQREHADRAGEAADRDQAELEIARHREQQRREADRAGAEDGERRRLHLADVAPDDAQRRHARELQHRRQAEAEQEREADAGAEQRRPEPGRRQHRLDQAGEEPDEDVVDGEAENEAGDARDQADQRELDEVLQRDRPLWQAEDAQHRAVVEMAAGEVARGDADRDRGEQRRQQGDQVEEFLGAVERLAHLGPACRERLDADAAQALRLDLALGPIDELGDLGVAAGAGGDREPVRDAARRLDQAGRGEVGLVQHHARRQAREARAAIGLDDDDAGDPQARIAEEKLVADGEAERVEHGGVDPHGARRRRGGDVGLLDARCIANPQLAAQRVGVAHRLGADQPRRASFLVGRATHAREVRHRRRSPGRGRAHARESRPAPAGRSRRSHRRRASGARRGPGRR
jgi:colicin import membrane protein